ncbi:MAG: hypothetical protein RR993_01725 [Clostridia bacterium]
MKAKDFFKGQAFKSILVLTLIALVVGGLLAILNDVLFISDEERTQQAIKKIYGKEVAYTDVALQDTDKDNKFGSIANVYKMEDGKVLIKSVGKNGYKNGTVTLWLVATFDNDKFNGFEKITVAGNTKQSLIGNFGDSFISGFIGENETVKGDAFYTSKPENDNVTHINAGATFSSTAFNNAVNSALVFVRNFDIKEGK